MFHVTMSHVNRSHEKVTRRESFAAEQFKGSIVALVTPFKDDCIDENALSSLVRWHIDCGTQGIVPVGTTGEASTLTPKEHCRVIQIVVEEAAGAVPVIAGAGSNNTAEAIKYSLDARAAGADGMLHSMGYYNRPNQRGILEHFRAITAACDLPMVVYNVPPRTIIDILPETLAEIARMDSVVGVKDATCDLARPLRERLLVEKPFAFLSGEDATAVAYNANGGVGCISVTANVAPGLCNQMQSACAQGDFTTALSIQKTLMPLHDALFIEPSPAGVKYACALLGKTRPECRLPIVELALETKQAIEVAVSAVLEAQSAMDKPNYKLTGV